MLDAFIIERIRQRRDGLDSAREPLRVEIPLRPGPDEPPSDAAEEPVEPDRGVVVIDDTI